MAKKIMIDPGHAPGNCNRGVNGTYYEYAGMWKLSNYLKEALEANGQVADLSRTENECPELTARGLKAKGCDVFISEHSNAGGGKGCECYYSVRISEDKPFADDLAAAVSGVLSDTSRGGKTWHSTTDAQYDYLTVMGYAVYAGCPHVFLCENGFHDNENDCTKLSDDACLKQLAEAQAKVILSHLELPYTPRDEETAAPSPSDVPAPKDTDRVRVRIGCNTYADGTGMADFVHNVLLYVRGHGDGKTLVSTVASGAVTGWVNNNDLVIEGSEASDTTPDSTPSTPAADSTTASVDILYRVRTAAGGWLPDVKNLEDYAGWQDSPVTDIAIKVGRGSISYCVHSKTQNRWLPPVTGCDIHDDQNGYAGNHTEVDAVKIYYVTPADIRPYKKAKYRVAPCHGDYFDWQYDNETGSGPNGVKQDGHAGKFGAAIGKVQIEIV